MIDTENNLILLAQSGHILVNKKDLITGNIVYLSDLDSKNDWEEITIAEYNKLNAQIKELDRQGKI